MPRHPPLLGMRRQQGRDSGEMECWETRADRLPAGERRVGSRGAQRHLQSSTSPLSALPPAALSVPHPQLAWGSGGTSGGGEGLLGMRLHSLDLSTGPGRGLGSVLRGGRSSLTTSPFSTPAAGRGSWADRAR